MPKIEPGLQILIQAINIYGFILYFFIK